MSRPVNVDGIMKRRTMLVQATPIVDAAVRAAGISGATVPALRSVCPHEPPAEWITEVAAAWRIARVPMGLTLKPLSEMAPGIAEMYRRHAIAAYRAQPLWQELWGNADPLMSNDDAIATSLSGAQG